MLNGLDQRSSTSSDFSRGKGEECITIISFKKNNIFYKEEGAIIYKENKYFYFANKEKMQDITYEIDSKYYKELSKIFNECVSRTEK